MEFFLKKKLKTKKQHFIKNQQQKICTKKFHTGSQFFLEVFSKKEAKHKNKVFWDINQLLELKYEDAEKSIKLQFRKSKQKK